MATSPKMISFTSPDADLQRQQMQLLRKQKLAEALQAQANTPLQGQTVSDGAGRQREVPISAFQTISKLLQSGLGAYAGRKADESQTEFDTQTRALADQQQRAKQAEMKAIAQALAGKPGQYDAPEERGMEGPTFSAPALAPDRNKALALALQSSDPNMQKVGGELLKDSMQKPKYSTVPHYDDQGRGFVLNDAGEGPSYLPGVRARDKMENVNGVWTNPYQQGNNTFAPQDPNKPFGMGPSGAVPNTAYQQYELNKAKAGASNVSVNTANKPFLTEIGRGAGEAVMADFQGAKSAAQTLQNVEQIRSGLGNAILGPGANARVTLAQIGETLGVTGKDTQEQLQNTRQVMQGLARQELAAAGQMKGQGQITESERAILRKAESGQISEMTAPEIKTLLGALDRTARYRIGTHQSNMDRLRSDPNARGVVDYMQVDAPGASGVIDDLLKKYGSK